MKESTSYKALKLGFALFLIAVVLLITLHILSGTKFTKIFGIYLFQLSSILICVAFIAFFWLGIMALILNYFDRQTGGASNPFRKGLLKALIFEEEQQ